MSTESFNKRVPKDPTEFAQNGTAETMDCTEEATSYEIAAQLLYLIPPVLPPSEPYQQLPPQSYAAWDQRMCHEMQEIIPGLFLGPYRAASKSQLKNLKSNGITHIICVRHPLERALIRPVHEKHFIYLIIEMGDDGTEPLIPILNLTNDFLDICRAVGGRALVHGNAGAYPSSSIVIGYIMTTYGVSVTEAYSYVKSKRFHANLTDWLFSQLEAYEPIYQARHSVPRPLPDVTNSHLKRQLEEDSD